jgi:hypothetical protein
MLPPFNRYEGLNDAACADKKTQEESHKEQQHTLHNSAEAPSPNNNTNANTSPDLGTPDRKLLAISETNDHKSSIPDNKRVDDVFSQVGDGLPEEATDSLRLFMGGDLHHGLSYLAFILCLSFIYHF